MLDSLTEIELYIADLIAAALDASHHEIKILFRSTTTKLNPLQYFLSGFHQRLYFYLSANGNIIITCEEPDRKTNSLVMYMFNINENGCINKKQDIQFGTTKMRKGTYTQQLCQSEYITNHVFLPCILFMYKTIPQNTLKRFINIIIDHSLTKENKLLGYGLRQLPTISNLSCLFEFLDSNVQGDFSLHLLSGPIYKKKSFITITFEKYLVRWSAMIGKILNANALTKTDFVGDSSIVEDEYMYWRLRKQQIKSIVDQIQTVEVRKILHILDELKSNMNKNFASLCKNLFWALTEAESNERFLRPLKGYFEALHSEDNILRLPDHFDRLIHLFSIVWDTSEYYNSRGCLIQFIECCNLFLYRKVNVYLLAHFVKQSNFESVPTINVRCKNQNVLEVIGKYKSIIMKYNELSYHNESKRPWHVADSILFSFIDSLLDWCQNLGSFLDYMEQSNHMHFVIFGGSNGIVCSHAAKQINDALMKTNAAMYKSLVDSIPGTNFKRGSYRKALSNSYESWSSVDNQIAVLIINLLTSHSNYGERIRILYTISPIIIRKISIMKVLQKSIDEMIQSCLHDMKIYHRMFTDRCMDDFLFKYSPPVVNLLKWSRCLSCRAKYIFGILNWLDLGNRNEHHEILKKIYVRFEGDIKFNEKQVLQHLRALTCEKIIGKEKISIVRKKDHCMINGFPTSTSLLSWDFDEHTLYSMKEFQNFARLDIQQIEKNDFKSTIQYQRKIWSVMGMIHTYNRIQLNFSRVERSLHYVALERDSHDISVTELNPTEIVFTDKSSLSSSCRHDHISLEQSMMHDIESKALAIKMTLANIESILHCILEPFSFWTEHKPMTTHALRESTSKIGCKRKIIDIHINKIRSQLERLKWDLKVDIECDQWRQFVYFIDMKLMGCLNRAIIEALHFFEKSILPNDGVRSILIEVGFVDMFCKDICETKVTNLSLSLKNAVFAIISLYADIGCISSLKSSFLPDMLSSENVLIILTRIERRIESTLCKSGKIIELIKSIELDLEKHRNGKTSYDLQQGANQQSLPLRLEHISAMQNSLQFMHELQNKLHTIQDHYDADFLRISFFNAKVSLDIEIFHESNDIIRIIMFHVKDAEKKLEDLETSFALQIGTQVDIKNKCDQFDSLMFNLKQLNSILARQNFHQYSNESLHLISKVKSKWEHKLTRAFKGDKKN